MWHTNNRQALRTRGTQTRKIGSMKSSRSREREMFYLTTHSTHFIYGYMASDIWLRTIQIVREETRCRHIGYSYRLTARVLLYAPSHRQDNAYHGLCYTSRGALVGTTIQEYCESLVSSMARHFHFQAVIDSKGGYTKY